MRLLIIDGPSAVGKSTIVNHIIEHYDEFEIAKRISTREKRAGDENDLSCDFISQFQYEKMIQNQELIEYKDYEFGMSYGLPKMSVINSFRSGKIPIGIISLGNVKQVKINFPNSYCVLIGAETETIRRRLEERGTHRKDQIEERILNAKKVSEYKDDYDLFILNDGKTIEEIVNIILLNFKK